MRILTLPARTNWPERGIHAASAWQRPRARQTSSLRSHLKALLQEQCQNVSPPASSSQFGFINWPFRKKRSIRTLIHFPNESFLSFWAHGIASRYVPTAAGFEPAVRRPRSGGPAADHGDGRRLGCAAQIVAHLPAHSRRARPAHPALSEMDSRHARSRGPHRRCRGPRHLRHRSAAPLAARCR